MVLDGAKEQYCKRGHQKNQVSDEVFVLHKEYINEKGDFGGVKTYDWHTFIKVIVRF